MKADIGWLDNPEVFRVNRLDAHSDHNFYQDPEDMGRECNSLLQPLNGIWKFRYSQNAGQRPVDFFEPGYDAGTPSACEDAAGCRRADLQPVGIL